AHHAANASRLLGQSRRLRLCPLWLDDLLEIISVSAERSRLFKTGRLQIPDLRSNTPAHRFDQPRSRRRFRFAASYFPPVHRASRWPSSEYRIAWLGVDA